jgi:prepilin-type processing-associated H-X9-DG protein
MVAEASDAVPWTKPDELEYDPKQTPKIGYFFGDRCNALFGDGSVHALKKTMDVRNLHLLIQRADGNPVKID